MALANSADLPKKHLTAREFVLEGIRDAMLSGNLVPGQELDDHALAATFGVSRTPVREALKVLEVQGFVTHESFSRPVVAVFSSQRIEEALLMRVALEGLAVSRACLTIDEAELKYLERCAESGRKALVRRDAAAWRRWNREFHTRLSAAAGMPLLSREVDSLIDLCSFYSTLSWKEIPDAITGAQMEHMQVLQACRERNPELARKRMQDHLVASCAVQVDVARRREEAAAAAAPASSADGSGKATATRGPARP